jgi:hypothetical protein
MTVWTQRLSLAVDSLLTVSTFSTPIPHPPFSEVVNIGLYLKGYLCFQPINDRKLLNPVGISVAPPDAPEVQSYDPAHEPDG